MCDFINDNHLTPNFKKHFGWLTVFLTTYSGQTDWTLQLKQQLKQLFQL